VTSRAIQPGVRSEKLPVDCKGLIAHPAPSTIVAMVTDAE
jgi:hypothetical protein